VGARSRRYLITMAVRVACFILMVAVQPYGWYTWVFAIGAVVLPYVAVVGANVGQDSRATRRSESPERALPATPSPVPQAGETGVVRIVEQRSVGSEPGPTGGRRNETPAPASEQRDAPE
jgi:NADH:ubiquinone oxidoreductase subunit 6 (subunit J)